MKNFDDAFTRDEDEDEKEEEEYAETYAEGKELEPDTEVQFDDIPKNKNEVEEHEE